jgi:hypothetical protein
MDKRCELLPTLKYPNGYVKADVNASIDVLENCSMIIREEKN